jgi:hypothetical protein
MAGIPSAATANPAKIERVNLLVFIMVPSVKAPLQDFQPCTKTNSKRYAEGKTVPWRRSRSHNFMPD